MLTKRTSWMKSTIVFQNKRKNSEKGGFFFSNMFANLFSIWLNRRQPFLYLLLPSVCCDIIHYVTSGKLHCTLKRNDSEKASNLLVLKGRQFWSETLTKGLGNSQCPLGNPLRTAGRDFTLDHFNEIA